MPICKPLCRLCECPTADGAVRATEVDRVKLRNWALRTIESHGCEDELDEEIKDDDLICYFCIWQSQFMSRYDYADESLAWWPEKLCLDVAAKELRKNFFDGEVDQCWVQLETITLPENADSDQRADEKSKSETQRADEKYKPETQRAKECVYCKKSVIDMRCHIRIKHKDAIRCDFPVCATFFHTLEEKKEHTKKAHAGKQYVKKEKANTTTQTVECAIPLCQRTYSNLNYYRKHVKNNHKDYIAKCKFKGCLMYFKTEIQLEKHNSSEHKINKYRVEKKKSLKCEHCPFIAATAVEINFHTAREHLSNVLECDICKKKFASISIMRTHMLGAHTADTYQVCRICKRNTKVRGMARHAAQTQCHYCSKYFACAGLFNSHLQHCTDQNEILKCSGCNKQFKWQSLLQYHMKRCDLHKYRHLGFQCETCRTYFKSKLALEKHVKITHANRIYMFCAHCPKKYFHFTRLRDHLAKAHDLIEKNLQCADCPKTFYSKYAIRYHVKRTHLKSMERVECRICGKSCYTRLLKLHMVNIHDVY
ncbi:Hypothetical predicted protein [Cloeon dipterum]|uniref:C2H2-type domain-containing protein n=1 Tax=Cloeon dipterum TaxID=197152 RepID=A0A8S1DZP1_9INSE|nr:Hypothetical predicted protein [Cloeon dipterum]